MALSLRRAKSIYYVVVVQNPDMYIIMQEPQGPGAPLCGAIPRYVTKDWRHANWAKEEIKRLDQAFELEAIKEIEKGYRRFLEDCEEDHESRTSR